MYKIIEKIVKTLFLKRISCIDYSFNVILFSITYFSICCDERISKLGILKYVHHLRWCFSRKFAFLLPCFLHVFLVSRMFIVRFLIPQLPFFHTISSFTIAILKVLTHHFPTKTLSKNHTMFPLLQTPHPFFPGHLKTVRANEIESGSRTLAKKSFIWNFNFEYGMSNSHNIHHYLHPVSYTHLTLPTIYSV